MTKKIVITGGPGGGKTTALDLFRREYIGKSSIVPEAATVLFSSGISRASSDEGVKILQKAIYEFQITLEELVKNQAPDKLIICDRGTLDGLAYWPGKDDDFFSITKSSYEKELERYDAVIFFETAASAGKDISSNNPYRNEDTEMAIKLDLKLQSIWSKHQNFHLVGSSNSFMKKINYGIQTIDRVISSMNK